MRGTKRRPTRQPASASQSTSDRRRVLAALEKPQPVLELGDAELQLFDLAARDEPELAVDAGEAAAGAFPQPHRLVAPAAHKLLDDRASLLAPKASSRGELLRERVGPLGGQRHGADAREDELLRELADGISGLGHEVLHYGAGGDAPASPAQNLSAGRSLRRATEWAPPPRLALLPRAPAFRRRPRQEGRRVG